MAAYSVETALNVTAQKRLDYHSGEDATVCFHIISTALPRWCEEGEHWDIDHVVEIYLNVIFSDRPKQSYTVSARLPMDVVLDGEMAPMEAAIDRLWTTVSFMRICGGSQFQREMEKVLDEVEAEDESREGE